MDKRLFFAHWNECFRITLATIESFPEEDLGRVLVPGLRPPGELFAHIFAHVNGMLNACVRSELIVDELYRLPADLDMTRTQPLVRYAKATMDYLLAHGAVNEQAWTQPIRTPSGPVTMQNLCLESFTHEMHHRGQLFVMLRLLQIEPPRVCRQERTVGRGGRAVTVAPAAPKRRRTRRSNPG